MGERRQTRNTTRRLWIRRYYEREKVWRDYQRFDGTRQASNRLLHQTGQAMRFSRVAKQLMRLTELPVCRVAKLAIRVLAVASNIQYCPPIIFKEQRRALMYRHVASVIGPNGRFEHV